MPNEFYVLMGASIAAIFAFIASRYTARTQLEIARINAEKDVILQQDRLREERIKNEFITERQKLDVLHKILSQIALENSQTMSYMQSESKLSIAEFRKRYLENCERMHEAMSIVDIYYPDMSATLMEIYGRSNMFWGHQEELLRTEIKVDSEKWQRLLSEILKTVEYISDRVRRLKSEITRRAETISKQIMSCD